ncbi:hypothetical protein D9M72_437060 [compost metagenome]
MDRAIGHLVVGDKDRARRLRQIEERGGTSLSAFEQVVAAHFVTLRDRQTGGCHRGTVTVTPVHRHHLRQWAGDMGDAAMPECDQMFNRRTRRGRIVDLHMRKACSFDHFERHDDGKVRNRGAFARLRLRQLAGHQDHAVGMAIAQHVEVFDLAIRIVLGIAHENGVAGRPGRRLHALEDLEIEGVANIAHDEQHRHRPACPQVSCADVRPVVQLARKLVDALARLVGHQAGAAERAGNGRDRDSGPLRNVLDFRPLAHARIARPRP